MHPTCVCNLLLRQWLHRRGALPRIPLRNLLTLQVRRYCLIILRLIFILLRLVLSDVFFIILKLSIRSPSTDIHSEDVFYQGNTSSPCWLTTIYWDHTKKVDSSNNISKQNSQWSVTSIRSVTFTIARENCQIHKDCRLWAALKLTTELG